MKGKKGAVAVGVVMDYKHLQLRCFISLAKTSVEKKLKLLLVSGLFAIEVLSDPGFCFTFQVTAL